MSFQHHAVTAAVTLLAQGTGQCRQQQVGHPGKVGLVGGVDEPGRGLLTELQQAGGGAAIGGARRFQQVTLAAFPLSQPEAKLILFPFGVGHEPLAPLAIAAALGGQRLAPAHPSQIFGQNAPGDRIDHQVMEGEKEPLHRLALARPLEGEIAQAGPGQGVAAGRVEISLQLGQAGLQLGLIEIGGIQGRQRRQWQFGQVTLAGRGHRQTQGIVVLAQGIQPAAQGLIVHPGRQAQDHPLVPMTGLGKALFEEPVLNGVERELAGQAALLAPVADSLLLAELAAEAAHRLGFEHVLHAAVQPRIPQPGGELDAEDGVTAQTEEVILHPERLLEHPLPDGKHGLLQFVLWLALALLPDDGGQAAQVQLAVGGERHLGQPAEARRHHVFGQALAGPLQQGVAVGLPCPGLQTGVSEQTTLLHHHLDLADDRAQFGEPGLYLPRLDAITAQLDLLVYPAQILDVAIAAQQGPIAGAIEAMGTFRQRQLDKGLLGALRQIEVAAGQPQPRQAELAGHPHRAEVARLVQDQRLQVVDGATDGDGRPRGEPRAERGDGALGRAVHVEQRHPLSPTLHQAARARLAAKADGLEGTEIRRWQQVREQGGRQNHMAGTASDRGSDHPLARLAEVQGRAAVQGQQAGHVARIEREGHAVEHGPALTKGDALAVIRHQVDQAALLHHDPLGQAGAAGGVDDLGQHGGVPGQCGRAG
ncbi:hypothetical protein D3C71_808290 [compost metagenome]